MSARVLVVDDILPNVKLLEATLKSEYYDVDTALNGMEALQKIEEREPDLVLLDVNMPEMNGFEVCQRIKADPKTAHIPVVMVTALTDATDRVMGLESGADDFLSKPVNNTALMARVRSLVRLKMTIDEWRIRENTATQFGVIEESTHAMKESVESASVLVVEDQSFEADKFKEALSRDHHDITSVPNGTQAIEVAGVKPIDLIVVSLNLSGEDGLRLCSYFRTNEKTRNLPILMVGENTKDDMNRIAHGLELGAHDYILRPVDRNELLARVRTQVRRKRFQERLRSNYEASLSMAIKDSLTGLYNRRYLMAHLKELLEKKETSEKPLGILMMDIDHFKSVNDTHGHNVGDEVLVQFAERISANLRSFDLVARMGGEEFVALLPDVSVERAEQIAERLRQSIEAPPMKASNEAGQITITTSLGGALISKGEGDNPEAVLERADKQLYEAKNTGRNKVMFEHHADAAAE